MATQVTLNSGSVDSAAGLKLRTNGTTEAVDISTGQVVTVAKDAVVNGLTVGKGAGSVSTNTAVGASALSNGSLSGGFNTGIGYNSLAANTSGGNGTALGYGALSANTTGGLNVAVGVNALSGNTTGGSNVGLGVQALTSNTTALGNTAVGYQAGYSATGGSAYNTFIGYQAGYTSSTGNGYGNTCIGPQAGYSLTTGYGNTFIGNGQGASGFYVTTGSSNTIIGGYNGNQGGLDIRTASNYIVLSDGSGNPRGYFNNNGSFFVPRAYLDTTASAANGFIGSDGVIARSTSALKYKQDIRDVEDFDINLLRPVRYKSKCEGDDQTKDHLGLIADEAAEAGFEELVTRGADGEVEGFQYERLTVVLLKKLQVLEAEVKALKGQA